jgi:hypothetical protein
MTQPVAGLKHARHPLGPPARRRYLGQNLARKRHGDRSPLSQCGAIE